MDSESRLPNRDELSAMFYNRDLIGTKADHFWSSSVISAGEDGTAWGQSLYTGVRYPSTRSNGLDVRCVKR